MPSFWLDLPSYFSDQEWEVTTKGWFGAARMIVSGKRYLITFYDAARLSQEIESTFERGEVFFEPNLVIVQSVTRANMERAAEFLMQSGQVVALVEEK